MKTYWNNPAGGNFFVASNWSDDHVPGSSDIAAITLPGAYTVTDNVNPTTVLGVTTAAGVELDIGNTDATIFAALEGTATGANRGAIAVEQDSTFQVGGTFTNSGSLEVNGTSAATVEFIAPTVLSATGSVDLDEPGATLFFDADAIVTNVSNRIQGEGTIQLLNSTAELVNQRDGIVNGNTPGQALFINGAFNTVVNSGLLEASDTGDLTIVQLTVQNTSGTIFADSGSTVILEDTTAVGGTIEALAGGSVGVAGIDTINGSGANAVTLEGALSVDNGSELNLEGTIDNKAAIMLSAGGLQTTLDVGGSGGSNVTLDGGGEIVLQDKQFDAISAFVSGAVLNNVDNTIEGQGIIGTGLTIDNGKFGLIEAEGPAALLSLNGDVILNSGVIEDDADHGNLLVSGGVIKNTTTGVLSAGGSFSSLDLHAAVVSGGTFETSDSDISLFDNSTLVSVTNSGGIVVDDGVLSGTMANAGTIETPGTFVLAGKSVTLSRHGEVLLQDPDAEIIGSSTATTLVNSGNTIAGEGSISNLILDNTAGSVIEAGGSSPLLIDTGSSTIANAGTMESVDAAELRLQSNVNNTGTLEATTGGELLADGNVRNTGTLEAGTSSDLYIGGKLSNSGKVLASAGTIAIAGAATGGGATISGSGEIEFGSAASMGVSFAAGSTGELVLDDSVQFSGTIAAFKAAQSIDLADIDEATATLSFTGGTLTVKDGDGHVAHIKFSSSVGTFAKADDGGGGTLITDPPPTSAVAPLPAFAGLALLYNYIASAFAEVGHLNTAAVPSAEFGAAPALLAPSHH